MEVDGLECSGLPVLCPERWPSSLVFRTGTVSSRGRGTMANFSPQPPVHSSVPGAEGAPQRGVELDCKIREGTETGGHPGLRKAAGGN